MAEKAEGFRFRNGAFLSSMKFEKLIELSDSSLLVAESEADEFEELSSPDRNENLESLTMGLEGRISLIVA